MNLPRTRVYTHYPTGDAKRQNGIPAVRATKNLGWLLRHASEVRVLCLTSESDGGARLSAEGYHANTNPRLEYTFVCDFASRKVAEQWIRRPSLAHAYVVR